MDSHHFVDVRELATLLGVKPASVWRGVNAGRLPKPCYPSPRAARWNVAEVLQALERTRALPREAAARRRAERIAREHKAAAAR